MVCREVEAAELQELTMVTEAAQVAGFSQYGQRDDGANAGQLAKPRGVGLLGQHRFGVGFDQVALTNQVATFGEDEPEHRDGRRIGAHRQSHGTYSP